MYFERPILAAVTCSVAGLDVYSFVYVPRSQKITLESSKKLTRCLPSWVKELETKLLVEQTSTFSLLSDGKLTRIQLFLD